MVNALNPDNQLTRVQQETGQDYITLDTPQAQAVVKRMLKEAVAPFNNPRLRNALLQVQQREEQILDVVSEDRLLSSEWDGQANEQAHHSVKSFQQFIEQHRDELTALTLFYSRPRRQRLQERDLRQLEEAIKAPPLDALHRQTLAGIRAD